MKTPGRVNLIGLAMITAIVFGIVWAVIIGPLYLERFDVVDKCSEALNRLVTTHERQETVRDRLVIDLGLIGTHKEPDENGVMSEVRGLGVPDDNIIVEVDEAGKALVQVTYSRTIILPLTGDPHTETFVIRKTNGD